MTRTAPPTLDWVRPDPNVPHLWRAAWSEFNAFRIHRERVQVRTGWAWRWVVRCDGTDMLAERETLKEAKACAEHAWAIMNTRSC